MFLVQLYSPWYLAEIEPKNDLIATNSQNMDLTNSVFLSCVGVECVGGDSL